MAAALVLLAAGGSAQEGIPDDDPRIFPDEVMAPALDSRDPAWKPVYESFEDPNSLNCGGRRACEDHKAIEVSRAQNETAGSS